MPTATDGGRGLHLRLTLSSGSAASSAGGPTSFKRSLEELFGGAESDGEGERSRSSTGGGGGLAVGGGGVGNGGGSSNGRNKRQRSESAEQPLQDSASSSSSSAASGRGLSLPPRLPTPRLDVHMSDIALLDSNEGLEFSSSQRHSQPRQQSSSSRSLPSPVQSTSASASTSTSPQSSTFATTQQTNLTLSAIHNSITSAHATTTAISSLGLGPTSIAASPSPTSSSSLPSSSSSSAPSSQSRSDRSSSPGLILPLSLSRSVQTPPAAISLSSPATRIDIGTGTGSLTNETEASPSAATAGGVTDLLNPDERFRATMQRYSVFENEIAALRRSVSPPGLSRSLAPVGMGGQQQQQSQQTASPPRLPPLELSSLGDEGDDVDSDEGDDDDEDRVRPLGPVRHGGVTSTSSAASASSGRSSVSSALHLPDRNAQRNHLEPFFALSTAAGVSSLPLDEDVDELEGDNDDETIFRRSHHQYQHRRISALPLVHGRRNRPVQAAVRDTPPRVELPNAVWSSLDIGSEASPSSSTRGILTTTTNHDLATVESDGTGEDNDDGNDAPEDDHNDVVYPRFRDHLDSALEALRSPSSPLVPGLIPNGIASITNEPSTTIILNDSESRHPSPISLSPPPIILSPLQLSSSSFSNSVIAPSWDPQSQGVSNSAPSLSEAAATANANMARRFGRPPTLPPILTEPTSLNSSSSSPGRGDGRYISHRLMMPSSSSSSSSSASSRERDEQSTGLRRRISIDTDNDHNEDNEIDGQATTNLRGMLQRSSNLGEVELPSPSLSEFYDWLGSPNSPDPDLLRDVVVAPTTNEDNSAGRSSGSSREETREERERVGELERRSSWEEDVLSGIMNTDLGLDLNIRQGEREQQQQQQISLPPPPPLPVRPTLERRLSMDDSIVGMDVDMESSGVLEARQRELELERLPYTLGSSVASSTTRTNQLVRRLPFHREARRFTPSISMNQNGERSRVYNDDVEAEDRWNPLHSTRHSESTPAASASPSTTLLPTFSSSLFSSSLPPPLTTPRSTAVHPSLPPPPSSAAASSGLRPRLPDFLLHTSSSQRRGRNHLSPLSRRSSSSATAGVGSERDRERRSSVESNDSLPPSLELNLGPSSHSVFGTSAESGSRGSRTAGEEVSGQRQHSSTSTPSSSSSSLTPFIRLFEPSTDVPPPSLGQQAPLLSSQQNHYHQNQRQRNPIQIEVLDDDDDNEDIDVILTDSRLTQPPERLQSLLRDEDRVRQRQRQRQQEQGRGREREQQHRYRPHTRIVGSDNSLVAENATETRRLYARMDVARRLHQGSSNVSSRPSGRSWTSGVLEEESLRNVRDDDDSRNDMHRDEERGREESGGIGESSERQRRAQSLASQVQHHRRQRSDASGRQVRYEDFVSRRFTRQFPDLLDGIGMPPRVTNSGGSGSTSNPNDRASGPRIIPPPPRPRLHSIRHVPAPFENIGSGNARGDDDNGHRSSMSWSQNGGNRIDNTSPLTTTATNAPPHQMSSEEEEWGTMFQLRSPGDHADPGTIAAAPQRPFMTDLAARPSLDSVSSSDSSMTDSFTSSAASSSSASGSNFLPLRVPNRGMFLDTELPSPGLGGLFDTLGTSSTATTAGPVATAVPHPARSFTANPSSAPSSVGAVAATSDHYSSNSSSGFLSFTTGRFTPSPVRTSDGDLDEESVVADETARLHSLASRLGSMRDEMVSEMMHWWDRPEGDESEIRMDVGGRGQRGGAQNIRRASTTHRSSVADFRHPGPSPPPSSTVAVPNMHTTDLTSSSSPSADAGSNPERERRNHVIDPALFAPGLFRNTMETFANRAREYAAQASSSVPSSFAAVSRPTPARATSISSPTMSSGFPPPQPTTALPTHATYMLAPEQPLRNSLVPRQQARHHHHHHHHSLSGGTQSPPMIPPLPFENDPSETAAAAPMAGDRARERSAVQEPLDNLANENEQMRQGYFSLLRRQRRDGMARRADENSGDAERPPSARFSTSAAPPNFLSSSSPSSTSTPFERRPLTWSQLERLLERSPERAEYHTSPGSSSRAAENRFRGNMEAMRVSIERQRRIRREAFDEQRRITERNGDVLRWRNAHNDDNNNPRPFHNGGNSGDAPTRNMATTDLPNTSGAIPDLIHDRVRLAPEVDIQTDNGTRTTSTSGNNNDSEHARSQRRRWYDVIHGNPRSVLPEEEFEDDSEDELDLETYTLPRRYRNPTLPNFGPRMPLPHFESRTQGTIERERENSSSRHRGPMTHPNSGYVGWIAPQGYERVGPRPRNLGGGQDTSGIAGGGGGAGGGASTAAGAVNDFGRSRLRERTMHRLRASAMASANNGPGGNGVSGMIRFGRLGRRFGDLGDYMNDDEFDASYESLLSLQEALGDVRPRSTPEAVLKKLETGKYKEWVERGGEIRCPICLEDYDSEDVLLKSGNCKHWLHKACLEEWFKAANTCPVCRTEVEPRSHSRMRCRRPVRSARRRPGSGNGGGSGSGNGSGNAGDPDMDPSSDPSGSGPNGDSGTGPSSNSSGRSGAFGGGEFW